MLTKRRFALGSAVLEEPILRRQLLEESLRADELLAQASLQAEQLLQQAREQRQRYLDEAVASFWSEANAQLQAIQEERASYQRDALSAVDSLLNIALSRLLDETDLPQRISALLRNLADGLPSKAEANLTCHPEAASTVRAWLQAMGFDVLWHVQEDPGMAPESLRLSNTLGTFHIDWTSLQRGLMPSLPDAQHA